MLLIAILASLFLLSASGEDDNYMHKLSAANMKFTVDFYKRYAESNQSTSFVSSPLSASMLFSMILIGADGKTAEQLLTTLGYKDAGLGIQDIHSAFRQMLSDEGSSLGVDIQNSVWNSQDFAISQQYKNDLQNDFKADVAELNFRMSEATDIINDWVKNATRGKIAKLFDSRLADDTVLVLVDAIFFKEGWKTKFPKDSTRNMTFKGINGDSDIPMMHVKSKFPFATSKSLDAQLLEMEYKDKNTSMVIILPDRVDGLNTLEGKLTTANLNESLSKLSYSYPTMDVYVPKFKLESKFDLQSIMKALNTTHIFNGNADLSGISDVPGLCVTEAIQKACLEVDEEGTVAAAASGASMSRMAELRVEFRADHPFIFLIWNKLTKSVLFMGRYT